MSGPKFRLQEEARGPLAAKLRQRKFVLTKCYGIPEDLLPGSLSLTHSRCGRKSCHCASERGHPVWLLTFMVQGKKRVERIPQEWVEDVQRRVEAGREFKDAVAEVFAANAQLLALWRRQTKGRHR
ncbi:MAG TPA: DUF6788 family protein [Myxococcota bacterium]|nr:DUF6788 family protein [Myxococcota bacterium]